MAEHTPLSEVLAELKQELSRLESAEHTWPSSLQREFSDENYPELQQVEELLHVATHETASQLGFCIQDIEASFARVMLRKKYRVFSEPQFNRIIARGWSTTLVHELQRELPTLSLTEISKHTKALCAAWQKLPSLEKIFNKLTP